MNRARQIPALDGLRGIAVLLVILHNTNVFPDHPGWAWPLAALATAGWIGVQLFFVLSGYLITNNLLASRGADNYYRAFFGRRVLRIFPLYFLALVLFLLVLPQLLSLSPEISASYAHQRWYWLFLNNWTQPSGQAVYWFPHFWSLAIEEQFYLVWPFLIALLPERRVALASLIVLLAACLLRVVLYRAGCNTDMIYMYTITRMDALAAGALLAALADHTATQAMLARRAVTLLTLAAVILLGGALAGGLYNMHKPGTIYVGYAALTVAFAILVGVCASETRQSSRPAALQWLLEPNWLRAMGKYSYAIYIIHLPLSLLWPYRLPVMATRHEAAWALLYSVSIGAVSFALGALSYQVIERHFLRLKRWLVPRFTAA